MSETLGTLAHVLLIGDRNLVDAGCTEVLNDSPVLRALYATTASHGNKHQYLKEDGAPTVGFRPVNTGRTNVAGTDVEVNFDLKYLDPSWDIDVAIADAVPASKGGAVGYLDRGSKRNIRQALFGAEKQFFYGTGNDSDGFVGLNVATTLRYKDSLMVVDATGSTANTGSSVWFMRTDDTETEAMVVLGGTGNISVPEEALIIQKVDGSGKPYAAYFVPMGGYMGLQVGSKYSIGRICNLTAQAGKGLTDALIYQMLAKFPASRRPTFMSMNMRSLEQLRSSRTATNSTGAPAPLPTEVANVPIIVTDSIVSTEPILTATP